MYIYDRGTANSAAQVPRKGSQIIFSTAVFERKEMRQSVNIEGLEISKQAYEQCVEWITETKILAHLKEDLIEYLKPYVQDRDYRN